MKVIGLQKPKGSKIRFSQVKFSSASPVL